MIYLHLLNLNDLIAEILIEVEFEDDGVMISF